MFASVSSGCCICFCKCFRRMFQVFQLFPYVCCKCFICLQTYVASVTSGCFKSRSDVASPSSLFYCLASVSLPPPASAGHAPPLPLFLDAGDARADTGPAWARETARETTACVGVRTAGARRSDFHFMMKYYYYLRPNKDTIIDTMTLNTVKINFIIN